MIRIENLSVSYKETLALKDVSLVLKDQRLPDYWSKWCWKINFIKGMLGNYHMKVLSLDDKEVKKSFTSSCLCRKIHIDYNFPIRSKECGSLGLYPSIPFHTLRPATGKKWQRLLKSLDFQTMLIAKSASSREDNSNVCLVPAALCRLTTSFLDELLSGRLVKEIIMNTFRRPKKSGKNSSHRPSFSAKSPLFRPSFASQSRIRPWSTIETFTETEILKAYGNELFSMEVTYDSRIYQWITKFPFPTKHMITFSQ